MNNTGGQSSNSEFTPRSFYNLYYLYDAEIVSIVIFSESESDDTHEDLLCSFRIVKDSFYMELKKSRNQTIGTIYVLTYTSHFLNFDKTLLNNSPDFHD